MEEKTVIIALRRGGSDYWEGYTKRTETVSSSWVDYYRSIGQYAKVPSKALSDFLVSEFLKNKHQKPF